MEQRNTRLRNAGFVTFFFSGICTISSGVVVSLLQEEYGFSYGMTGTLLSLLIIGKVAESAGLAVGMATNIVPCVGLIVFAILVSGMREE